MSTTAPAPPSPTAGPPPPPGARERSVDTRVVGGLLLSFGVGWLAMESGMLGMSWTSLLAGVLLLLGVGMVVTPRAGHGGRLVALGIALTIALASISSLRVHVGGGVGDTTERPAVAADIPDRYEQTAGELT